MFDPLCLLVEVPVCAFRPYASREYQDTYPVPTPASVYGMLLSLIGVCRKDKGQHRGADLALAVEAAPERSKVFRKLRRGADLEQTRPDYQDVLTDLRLWVWVRRGNDPSDPCLADRIRDALANWCADVTREGGLSLGESSYLVDAISCRQSPPSEKEMVFLIPDKMTGFYSLPVWVDHANPLNTVPWRFRLSEPMPVEDGLKTAWFQIGEHQ